MPGPKMGPRPVDFDEAIVRQSPTFARWTKLQEGQRLRYACREFIKGHGDDEERLMRRIMIARRNNIRDHELLKQARKRNQLQQQQQQQGGADDDGAVSQTTAPLAEQPQSASTLTTSAATQGCASAAITAYDSTGDLSDSISVPMNPLSQPQPQESSLTSATTERQESSATTTITASPAPAPAAVALVLTDAQVEREMDIVAVEATRSYKTWAKMADGQEFCYNQKYTKGREGHDWLLKKNIWRRMRYRRENKKMVQRLRLDGGGGAAAAADDEDGIERSGESCSNKRQRTSSGNDGQNTEELTMSEANGNGGMSSAFMQHKTRIGGTSDAELGLMGSGAHHNHHHGNISILPVHVTSETAAALAASAAIDHHAHAMMMEQAEAACLTDPEAIAAAVAAGESFGKSQQQIHSHHHHHHHHQADNGGMMMMGDCLDHEHDDDDDDDKDSTSHLVHDPLALEDAAATAAKLAEAGHMYGTTLDGTVEETPV